MSRGIEDTIRRPAWALQINVKGVEVSISSSHDTALEEY
jgi:hypothetical protein